MPRVFVYDGREFPDIDPKMTIDEVRQHYAGFFPELSNADTKETKRKVPEATINGVIIPAHDDDIIDFKKRVGTKGFEETQGGARGPQMGPVAREIKAAFMGVEEEADGTLTIIYVPEERQVLEAHKEYRIVIRPLPVMGTN